MNLVSEIQKLLAQNKVEEAQKLIESNKQKLDYDDYHAYYGLSLEINHQYEEAMKEYYKVQYIGEKISPKFYHFHLAVCLNALGKPKQALAHLVEIEDYVSKKDIPLHFQFYVTYNMLGEDEKAKEHIETICKISKDPFYQIRYANLLNNFGNFQEAYEIEKKLYKKFPEDPFLLRELSCSSYNLKSYEESKQYLKKLIELKESTDWDYLYLANIYILYDQYQEALEILKKIKETNAHVYIKYAYCYSRLKKEKKAIDYYEKAITEDSKNIIGISSYAAFYREKGKYEEAKKVLTQYKKKNPEYSSRIYYELAKVESDQEEYKKAITYLKKAEKIDVHPLILCDLAWNYKQIEKYKEEKEVLEEAMKWLPKDGWVLLEMGSCLLQLGKYKEALKYYSQVNINHTEIDWNRFCYEVAFCHEMLGNFEVAQEFFLKVTEKESYTYGHLVRCSFELDKIEEMKSWAEKIDFKNEKDPWFLEIHLKFLEGIESYLEMDSFIEKEKQQIPRILYLKKKVLCLLKTSKNRNDSKLKEAQNYQKEIEKIQGETAENILREGQILNRMGFMDDARKCLKKVEKLGRMDRLLKQEWIYNYLLSEDKKELQTASRLSKELYEDTKKLEDLLLVVISEYKNKHYRKALFKIRNLKKQGFSLELMEIIEGICYLKLGLKSRGNRILKAKINENEKCDLLEEFLRKEKKA